MNAPERNLRAALIEAGFAEAVVDKALSSIAKNGFVVKYASNGRDKLLRALQRAGDAGLPDAEYRAVTPLAGAHAASLIADGYHVESHLIRNEYGQPTDCWRLRPEPEELDELDFEPISEAELAAADEAV